MNNIKYYLILPNEKYSEFIRNIWFGVTTVPQYISLYYNQLQKHYNMDIYEYTASGWSQLIDIVPRSKLPRSLDLYAELEIEVMNDGIKYVLPTWLLNYLYENFLKKLKKNNFIKDFLDISYYIIKTPLLETSEKCIEEYLDKIQSMLLLPINEWEQYNYIDWSKAIYIEYCKLLHILVERKGESYDDYFTYKNKFL